MRRFLVSSFLADVTQQIHSFRASGVIPAQRLFAAESDSMARRKSDGSLCKRVMKQLDSKDSADALLPQRDTSARRAVLQIAFQKRRRSWRASRRPSRAAGPGSGR